MEPTRTRSARKALVHLLCALLLCVLVNTVCSKPVKWEDYCNGMSSAVAKAYCSNYTISDTGEARTCAALTWRQSDLSSYFCSGINDACLSAEARLSRNKNVVRVCSPLPEGAPCGSRLQRFLQPRCVRGVCTDKFGHPVLAPDLPKQPVPSAARLGGTTTIRTIPAAPPAPTSTPKKSTSKSTPAAPAAPLLDSITVDIDTVNLKHSVPHGFMGISLEWQGIEYYGSEGTAWANVLSVLGPEPVIRVGGASQDKLTEVPADASWAAMAKLHKEIGMKFIIGVPLTGNNPDLAFAMIVKAREFLPEEAILGFELGNEPVYWACPGLGGWDNEGTYQPGWYPYATYFQRMAKMISGCDKKGGKTQKVIMGPGWDNLNTFTPQRLTDVLGTDSSCYLADVSLHYYPYYKKNAFDHQTLLSEDLMREAQRNATLHVKSAAAHGHALRITEANSISGAGEAGTSDAYAAALWTADLAFEFAAAGVKSMEFHWGVGGLPDPAVAGGSGVPVYAGIRTYHNADGTTAPMVRPPFFGYMLFQAAVSPRAAAQAKLGDTVAGEEPGRLAPITAAAATRACSKGQIKIWPVMHTSNKQGRSEVRVVVLNKSDKDDCYVTLQLNNAFGDAQVTRVQPDEVTGPGRMTSKVIKYGGATYTDKSGLLDSPVVSEAIKVTQYSLAKGSSHKVGSRYTFNMPRATAVILVAQDRSSVIAEAAVVAATVQPGSSVGEDIWKQGSSSSSSSSSSADEELIQLEKAAASIEQPVPSSLNMYRRLLH